MDPRMAEAAVGAIIEILVEKLLTLSAEQISLVRHFKDDLKKLEGSFSMVKDYSLSAALKCLNEMEDIPQTSEMYLDAFEILRDNRDRESFICLPPEPRRRWMQRLLHGRHPLRYGSNLM